MQKCPKCLAEQNNVNSSACYYCGADMSEAVDSESINDSNDIYSDRDEYIPEASISLPDTDELGIETNADIMESEALEISNNSQFDNSHTQNNFKENTDNSSSSNHNSQDIKKLSDNEIKEIEKNLYKSDEFINNKEKNDLIEKISFVNTPIDKPFSNEPIEPPKNDKATKSTTTKPVQPEIELPKPQIAKKGQGIAYFFNSYIQIKGSQKLHSNDIVAINQREYILKPKNFNNKIALYGIAAMLLLVVSVVGSFLAGSSNVGNGQVLGIILDDYNNPYIEGATIIFTELGEKSKSDAQGLFTFSNIPAGSHKIEYLIDGELTGSDYITIADNKNSHVTLRPNLPELTQEVDPREKLALASAEKELTKSTILTNVKQQEPPKQIVKESKKKEVTSKKTSTKNTSAKKTTSTTKPSTTYGKLVLNANVDGAKIKVDGNVLGAGNLTYSKIKSGKHSYTVSLDGYETKNGSFTIKDGETKTLSPSLVALTQTQKKESYKTNDYFYSASNAFNQGDYKTAISDYQKVINETPNSVESYYGIAESYTQLKKWDLAYENYIRAAEIHRFKNRLNEAITCYNNAIEVDDKSTTAFLGRGNVYLALKEYIAALGDFDKVVKLDKRSFQGYYGMGETSFNLQRYEKAIKYFKDARSLNDENTLVYQYLTLSYMFEHDKKNAVKSFEKFEEYATENEKNSFQKNSQYSAVTKYVNSGN